MSSFLYKKIWHGISIHTRKCIPIKNTEGILNIGYVYVEGQKLSQHVQSFLEDFKKTI